MAATLRLVPGSGAPIEVKGDSALVGREPGCDVVVPDGSVSRKHARLEWRDHGWTVTDQGSANGTFVDSQRVAESPLRAGQDLRFGAVSFRVEVEGDDISATVVATISPESTVVASPQMMPTPPLGVPSAASVSGVPNPPPAPKAPSPPTAGGPPPVPKAPPPPARPPAAAPPPPRTAAPPPLPSAPPSAPSAASARDRFASATPAAPVGQMAPPPAAAKKGKGPLFWILTGCCGCLLLVVLLVGGIGGAAFFATQAPAQAVQSQLADLRQGNLEGAYARLSRDLQAQLSREDFERLVSEHPGLRENQDATFWNRSVQNDRAQLSGMLTARSGDREMATFELTKEGGDWRITAIRLGQDAE